MKIISWNINGLRAAYKKNFLVWFRKINADVICLQEIKAQASQLPPELIAIEGYNSYFNSAYKKGYAGVAVYTKNEPLKVSQKLNFSRFDQEGRILELDYSNFKLINLYLPHGGRKKENLDYKLEVYKILLDYLEKRRNDNILIIGDFNIAHEEIDLARPKENQRNIMFTPKERKQINGIVDLGFLDTFREFNKEIGNYTWWPYSFNARERNLGWRIDYMFMSESLKNKLKTSSILKEVKGSDHCPIECEIEVV